MGGFGKKEGEGGGAGNLRDPNVSKPGASQSLTTSSSGKGSE